jgi:hypothetical protein
VPFGAIGVIGEVKYSFTFRAGCGGVHMISLA